MYVARHLFKNQLVVSRIQNFIVLGECHLNYVSYWTHLHLTYLLDKNVLMNSYVSFVEVHKRRVHNTEKSFKCSECDYAANILCDLQNHRMRMHSTDRSYKCDLCEEGFSTATRRNNHIAQGEVMHTASNVHFTDFEKDVLLNTSFRNWRNASNTDKMRIGVFLATFCIFLHTYVSDFFILYILVHERGPHFPCTECCYKTHTKNLLQMHIKARHTSTEVRFRSRTCSLWKCLL